MAHDILTIPISTIASESTFSTGGWVLDKYRSALKENIVEALICTRDWVFGKKHIYFINYVVVIFEITYS